MTTASFRAQVRQNVVALLLGATDAGMNVESNRASDTETTDMPFLGVYTGHEMKTLLSDAGTDTLLDATLTLHVDVRVAELRLPNAECALDTLIDQVQAALFTAPAFWMPQRNGSRLIKRVGRVEVHSVVKGDASAYLGEAQIAIDLDYSDAFPTALAQTFGTLAITVDPNAPAPVPSIPPVPVTVDITLDTPGTVTSGFD